MLPNAHTLTLIANGVGLVAVVLFVASYQMKRRSGIILCNAVSRTLYILQYILLGAFSGAVLDVIGLISSVLAAKKDARVIKKLRVPILILINLAMLIATLLLYKTPWDILPFVGVLLHTTAFWLTDEKKIRALSILGSPFWLAYNAHSLAFGSAAGDLFTIISIGIAILRYDILKRKKDA